jgi:hypothetical protein
MMWPLTVGTYQSLCEQRELSLGAWKIENSWNSLPVNSTNNAKNRMQLLSWDLAAAEQPLVTETEIQWDLDNVMLLAVPGTQWQSDWAWVSAATSFRNSEPELYSTCDSSAGNWIFWSDVTDMSRILHHDHACRSSISRHFSDFTDFICSQCVNAVLSARPSLFV